MMKACFFRVQNHIEVIFLLCCVFAFGDVGLPFRLSDSVSERTTRNAFKSAVERHLSKDSLVIADHLSNNIKGHYCVGCLIDVLFSQCVV